MSLENIMWLDIIWYNWKYKISSNWKVTKDWKEIFYSIKKSWNHWYKWVQLRINWKRKFMQIHRLVAIHFINNPENKLCVNHIDWNWFNNNIENLEWCTHSENELHSFNILWKQVWNKWLKLTNKHINKCKVKRLETLKEISFKLYKEFLNSWKTIWEFEKDKWKSRWCLYKRFKQFEI